MLFVAFSESPLFKTEGTDVVDFELLRKLWNSDVGTGLTVAPGFGTSGR